MTKEERIKIVRAEAERLYRDGAFYCAEAVVAAVRAHLAPEMPEALIAAASGFPVGVGRSKCMCGAVSGGVLCLGYLFGRTEPSAESRRCLELAGELQESFRSRHKGVLCCYVHTRGMDMARGEHKAQCVAFTGEIAEKVAEIALREWNTHREPG